MQFSPALFNGALSTSLGQPLKYRAAAVCPCFNADSGSAKPDCPICGGVRGVYWGPEVDAVAGLQNMTPSRARAAFGEWHSGDATLTIPGTSAAYGARIYDRFRAVRSTHPFDLKLRRGYNEAVLGTLASLTGVAWTTPDGTAVISSPVPTVVDEAVVWPAGQGPADGLGYVLSGVRYDEVFIFDQQPQNRNTGVDGLPQKLIARRLDLFSRN